MLNIYQFTSRRRCSRPININDRRRPDSETGADTEANNSYRCKRSNERRDERRGLTSLVAHILRCGDSNCVMPDRLTGRQKRQWRSECTSGRTHLTSSHCDCVNASLRSSVLSSLSVSVPVSLTAWLSLCRRTVQCCLSLQLCRWLLLRSDDTVKGCEEPHRLILFEELVNWRMTSE